VPESPANHQQITSKSPANHLPIIGKSRITGLHNRLTRFFRQDSGAEVPKLLTRI